MSDAYTCEHCDATFDNSDDVVFNTEFCLCLDCHDSQETMWSLVTDSRPDLGPGRVLTDLDRMAQSDPAGFYAACKGAPDTLPGH